MEFNIMSNEDIQEIYSKYWYVFNDKKVSKELSEQMFVEIGDLWIVQPECFVCVNNNRIKYMYVFAVHRGNGLGSYLLDIIPKTTYTAIATKASKNIFLKAGFQIIKSFKNFFHVSNQSTLKFNN